MSGRALLSLSAVVLLIVGGMASFAPLELARLFDPSATSEVAVAIQLLASGLLGFAIMNWMSRGSRIGGIYGRPLGMGNLLLFASGALALGKGTAAKPQLIISLGLCAVFTLMAISFAWLVFVHDPLSDQSRE